MKHSIPKFHLGLAPVLASLAGQALAQSSPPQVQGSDWQAWTTMAPAVAVSKTTKNVAWRGASGYDIWFSSLDSKTWTKQQIVGGSGWTDGTSAAPALAFTDDAMHLAWKSESGNDIWYTNRNDGEHRSEFRKKNGSMFRLFSSAVFTH